MPILDPDTGNPVDDESLQEDESTNYQPDYEDDEATQFSVEQSLTETTTTTTPVEKPRRKGLLGRFRRRGNKENQAANIRDQTPSPKPAPESRDSTPATDADEDEGEWANNTTMNTSSTSSNNPTPNKSAAVVFEEKQTLKQVRFPVKDAIKSIPIRQSKVLDKAPTAREAAFAGPPRYDWIDIETAAALKVQSVARRNKCMKELEEKGITTAVIRNRSRRRKAKMNSKGFAGSADIPNVFACCGVGLAFGEATEENYAATRQRERDLYQERKKEKEAREEKLRQAFLKMSAQKKSKARLNNNDVQETFEVVEEETEEEEGEFTRPSK